jgi:CO dehydrogenase/acetyl-CoA synthase delta subunit
MRKDAWDLMKKAAGNTRADTGLSHKRVCLGGTRGVVTPKGACCNGGRAA